MIVNPLSDDLLYETGGEYEFNSTNFPCCKLAMRASYIRSGATTFMDDPFSGIALQNTGPGSGFTDNGDGTFTAGAGAISTTDGAIASAGTSQAVGFILVGNITGTGRMTLGDVVNGPGAAITLQGVTDATYGYITRNSTNYHSLPDITGTISSMTGGVIATTWDGANNTGAVYARNGSTYHTAATTASLGTLAGAFAFADEVNVGPNGRTAYGIYYCVFATAPTAAQWKAAVSWMHANPTKGLYPGFKGLT